jgi:flagellar export protein FliJ
VFRFRFEVLLKVKRVKKDIALQAFATAQRYFYALQSEKMGCLNTIAKAGDELLELFKREVKADELMLFYNYQTYLLYKIKDLEQEIEQAGQELERKREQFMKARKEFKAIARLKDIRMERYNIEQGKLEMKVIDEMAVTRHMRAQ